MHDPTKIIDFLKENPISFFWVAGSLSAAGAMSCISAYLSIFDKSLVWLVELNDVLKISVIFGGFIIFFIYSMSAYYSFRQKHNRANWFLLTVVAIGLISFSIDILHKFIVENNDKVSLVAFYVMLGFTLFLLYNLSEMAAQMKDVYDEIGLIPADSTLTFVVFILFAAISCSMCYGQYVKYVMDHKLTVEYEIQKGEITTVENAAMVMMLSHHCIITSDGKTYMLRTPDIIQISVRK